MINAVIIEDEFYAASFLKDQLRQVAPDIEVVATLESIADAVKQLPLLKPSLVFADIQLEDGLSFSIFEQLKWKGPVIFITAYDAYAIRAFKVNGIDYLLKPFDVEGLRFAIDKFRTADSVQQDDKLQHLIDALKSNHSVFKERFAIQLGTRLISVTVAEVAYFCFGNRVTYLVTASGQRFPLHESLDKVNAQVDPRFFFRINRSYLIHHRAIERIDSHAGRNITVQLQPAAADGLISVSKDRITEFKNWLDQ